MFKYHQKYYDISKYINATLVQSVKSRTVTSEYQMKSYFHFPSLCQIGSSNWATNYRERVCVQGQSLAGWILNPKLSSKIPDPFRKVHRTKKRRTRQLCLFFTLGYLSLFCEETRYTLREQDRHSVKTSFHPPSS